MRVARLGVFVAVVAFLAAIAGAWAGRALLTALPQHSSELHEVLHHDLKLDAAQERRIEALERGFAVRRRALESELKADNARLGQAIEEEHGYGPRVAGAVDASHAAMGQLQKETLAHIFSMRALLRPDQAAKFDKAVVSSLTDASQ